MGPINHTFTSPGTYIIRGRNGAGKTTLLRSILGRVSYRGSIEQDSLPIGAVGVEAFFIGSWTIVKNWNWILSLINQTARPLPEAVQDLRDFQVRHLSQGMRRKAELEFVFNLPLPTLLLDEAFHPLDSKNREDLLRKLHDLSKSRLVLLTSHSLQELEGNYQGVLELS
jgi:ABC-2 type transport system ATP-binding protein